MIGIIDARPGAPETASTSRRRARNLFRNELRGEAFSQAWSRSPGGWVTRCPDALLRLRRTVSASTHVPTTANYRSVFMSALRSMTDATVDPHVVTLRGGIAPWIDVGIEAYFRSVVVTPAIGGPRP